MQGHKLVRDNNQVLSDSDRAFWEENGYVVVPDAVPRENLDRLVEAIWEFLEIDPDDPEDWYRHDPYTRERRTSPISSGGMVEIYQHQAIWDNRQFPRVHQAFAEIWGDEKLWVSLDRANMKPPAREDKPAWNNKGMIHWDMDTSKRPITFGVQGVLYLTDTAEDQGGFQCVPGFHRMFDEWVKTQPEDRNPSRPDLEGLTVKPIPGKAGDLLIWHRLLAHTATATIARTGRVWPSTSPCRRRETPKVRAPGSRPGGTAGRRGAGRGTRATGSTGCRSRPGSRRWAASCWGYIPGAEVRRPA